MPTFVPVTDTERAKCEQNLHDAEFAEHRQFDAPHAMGRTKPKVDRGWAQGELGWGVLKSFGADDRDDLAQLAKHAEGGHKMVRNEKGLWVKAKSLVGEDETEEKIPGGMGRGKGISVMERFMKDNLQGNEKVKDDVGSSSNKQFADAVEDKFDYKQKPKRENKPTERPRLDSREKDSKNKQDRRQVDNSRDRKPVKRGRSRDSRDRNRTEGRYNERKRGHDDSRDRKYDYPDRTTNPKDKARDDDRVEGKSTSSHKRARSPSLSHSRSHSRERSKHSKRRSPSYSSRSRTPSRSPNRSRSRSRSRSHSRSSVSTSSTTSHHRHHKKHKKHHKHHKKEKKEKKEKKHAKKHHHHRAYTPSPTPSRSLSPQPSKRLPSSSAHSSSDRSRSPTRHKQDIVTENLPPGDIAEVTPVVMQQQEEELQEEEKEPIMTAIQIINRFQDIYSTTSLNTIQREELFHQILHPRCHVRHLRNDGKVYFTSSEDILRAYRTVTSQPVIVSKRIYLQYTTSPDEHATWCLDFHRPNTSPGLGDNDDCQILLYQCSRDEQIMTIWGCTDIAHWSENTELTIQDVIGKHSTHPEIWQGVEKIVKQVWKVPASITSLASFAHYHNYDHMEVWG